VTCTAHDSTVEFTVGDVNVGTIEVFTCGQVHADQADLQARNNLGVWLRFRAFADTDAVALLMMVLGAALRSTRRQSHSISCNNPGQQGPQGWFLEINGPFALISSSSS